MFYRLLLASIFFISVSAEASSSKLLDSVRNQLKGKESFKVSFDQEVKQEIFPEHPAKAKGFIEFKKPQDLRWVYTVPDKKEIIFNSKGGFIVRQGDPPEEIPNARALGVEESFGFLWGEMNLNQFKVKDLNKDQVEIKPLHSDKAQFEKMIAKIQNAKIVEVQVFDRLGGESKIRFSNWR